MAAQAVYTSGLSFSMLKRPPKLFAYLAIVGILSLYLWRYHQARPIRQLRKEELVAALIEITGLEESRHYYQLRCRYQSKFFLLQQNKNQALNFQPGDFLLVTGNLSPLPYLSKPRDFDYGQYLFYQGYSGQIELKRYERIHRQPSPLWVFKALRMRLEETIEAWPWPKTEKALFKALFLGQKAEIGTGIKKNFQAAGIMHLLAVSGLHLGILFILLSRLGAIFKGKKWGRFLSFTLVLVGIWSFAFLTGAGASVLRSATMFSFLAIGQLIRRKSQGLRPVLASALLLIWIKPLIVHQVGFQLSYAAVIGIIFLLPKLNAWHQFKHPILKGAQQIIYVSIAAQLFTAPLSLYYFKSFPSYFMVANLLILPLMPIIMYGGIILLILEQFKAAMWLLEGYSMLLKYLLGVGQWIADWPHALIDVPWPRYYLMACLLFLGLWILGIPKRPRQQIMLGLLIWILGSGLNLVQKGLREAQYFIYREKGELCFELISPEGESQKLKLEDLPHIGKAHLIELNDDQKITLGIREKARTIYLCDDPDAELPAQCHTLIYTGWSERDEKKLRKKLPSKLEFVSLRKSCYVYP